MVLLVFLNLQLETENERAIQIGANLFSKNQNNPTPILAVRIGGGFSIALSNTSFNQRSKDLGKCWSELVMRLTPLRLSTDIPRYKNTRDAIETC